MEEEIKELKKEKDRLVNKIFYLALQIAFIFLIPALIGVFFGKKLDAHFETGQKITSFILAGTFIISWIFVKMMYNRLSSDVKKVEKEIEKKKAENNQPKQEEL